MDVRLLYSHEWTYVANNSHRPLLLGEVRLDSNIAAHKY